MVHGIILAQLTPLALFLASSRIVKACWFDPRTLPGPFAPLWSQLWIQKGAPRSSQEDLLDLLLSWARGARKPRSFNLVEDYANFAVCVMHLKPPDQDVRRSTLWSRYIPLLYHTIPLQRTFPFEPLIAGDMLHPRPVWVKIIAIMHAPLPPQAPPALDPAIKEVFELMAKYDFIHQRGDHVAVEVSCFILFPCVVPAELLVLVLGRPRSRTSPALLAFPCPCLAVTGVIFRWTTKLFPS